MLGHRGKHPEKGYDVLQLESLSRKRSRKNLAASERKTDSSSHQEPSVTEKEKLINPSLPISTTHLSPPAATILNAISPPIPAIN
ncbi:hypothetical protein V6N11_076450 [Hibiscus sabdariffa]|uniref:Uncharacterized protein n=1 Tax=Hibiscus sabdariffa TaxID=183260 RepID=A0ABR2Q699_9ROSI